jgi:hypothetical protein
LTFAVSAIVAGAEPYYRCALAAPIKEFLRSFVKTTTCFSEFAEDPVGLQVAAISVASEIPVHPRLAKILKEYGVWKAEVLSIEAYSPPHYF